MNLLVSRLQGNTIVVRFLVDRFSPSSSRTSFHELREFIRPGAIVAFDLESVTSFDAPALSLMLRCARQAEYAGASLRIFNLGAGARLMAEMARLNQIVDIFNTEADAIQATFPASRPSTDLQKHSSTLKHHAVSAS
jgi:anti-anti-sigma regulatory factor